MKVSLSLISFFLAIPFYLAVLNPSTQAYDSPNIYVFASILPLLISIFSSCFVYRWVFEDKKESSEMQAQDRIAIVMAAPGVLAVGWLFWVITNP